MRIRRLLIPCLLVLAMASCAHEPTSPTPAWSLIPQPASLQPAARGSVRVADGDAVAVQADNDASADTIVERFRARVATLRGLQLVRATAADRARIVFRLEPNAAIDNDASYRIHVGNDQITATAGTARGLFYASVTIGQLLTPDAGKGTVRVADGDIADRPRFAWRGLMLDSARHFQSVEQIKQLIDWMSLHKLNVLHWHLTDDQGWRLQIKRYPKLTAAGACRKAVGPDAALTGGPDQPYCGFYTQDQARELVRYAAARYITIVPEIEIPGHAQAALHAYPSLGVTGKRPPVSTDWGINTWLYAPNDNSIEFLQNVLTEVMDVFPSKYIHIGGDEAAKDQWLASPKAQAQRKRLGLKDMNALQGWMIDRIGAYLAKHGRTMVGWDEILDGGDLPASAVVMSWHGVDGAVKAAEKGHDTILSPSPTLYLDHVQSAAHDEPPGRPAVESLRDVYQFNPVPSALSADQAGHILGLQANLWAEYMPTFARSQLAIFPRMAAWAELAWSPAAAIDWNQFLARMPAQVARYQALGIDYADSAWAPRVALARRGNQLSVQLSNQSGQGAMHYTTDGSEPSLQSPHYTDTLQLPLDATTTLRVATFTSQGLQLAATRTRKLSSRSLLTRNSDQLDTCHWPKGIPLRIEDDRPLDGPRPVYKVDIADTCWVWKNAPLDGITKVSIRVGNLPWNYALWKDAASVVARPDPDPAGHMELHLDQCDGPTLARLPLDQAARSKEQTTLEAEFPAVEGAHDLCIIATGDPRKGVIRVVDTVELSQAKPTP